MRVLIVADTAGGVWTYATDLVDALHERGVTAKLVAMGPREPERSLEWRPYALEWMNDPWDDVAAAGDWLLRIADEFRPDVVHLNGYAHASLEWNARVLVVAHSDVVTWWRAVRGGDPPRAWDRYRSVVENGLAAADVVAAPTRAYLEDVCGAFAFDTETLVLANGRVPLAPLPKEPYVAAAGRAWDEAKNLAALERAASRVPWPIRIADGSVPLDELYELTARAGVFAAPGLYEPFGLAALEAASAGAALVVGDLATQREIWQDAALYVDGRDDDAIADALARLVADDALRSEMQRRARERASCFTAERMADDYLALYEQLAVGVAA